MQRLRHVFDSPADFAAEFERNISKGGAQVPSSASLDPRTFVEVELALRWRKQSLVFEAEVVFSGGGVVAVQFRKSAPELRSELAPLLGAAASSRAARPAEVDDESPFGDADIDLDDGLLGGDLGAPAADPRAKTVLRISRDAPRAPAADPLANVRDRRKAGRVVARVPARVESTHASFEGRTRDLSETGALISGDASDLPLGKTVKLELQHPESGERIAVKGRVSRHVQAEGTVAAVGVAFEAPPERADEIRNFVSDVRRAEAERARSGISGRIEELGVANLIQMLGQSSPQGTLTASHGAEEATIAFEGGAIRYALLGPLRGSKAIARMLQWGTGTFSFFKHIDAITDEPQPIPLQNALLEAARQVDEAARSGPLDMKARFRVDIHALPSDGDLTKLEEAIVDLATAGLTVRRMIDVIPDADAHVVEAIRGLLERGILVAR